MLLPRTLLKVQTVQLDYKTQVRGVGFNQLNYWNSDLIFPSYLNKRRRKNGIVKKGKQHMLTAIDGNKYVKEKLMLGVYVIFEFEPQIDTFDHTGNQ